MGKNLEMLNSKLQDLLDVSRLEKADALGRLEHFKEFFRRLSGKGIPAPEPSTFEFITDEELRKFTETPP